MGPAVDHGSSAAVEDRDDGWAKHLVDELKVGLVHAGCAKDLAGFRVIPRRWVVERTLAWISKHRRCVRPPATSARSTP
jgi:hypothetical protein